MKKIFAISIIFLICTIGKTATDSNNIIVPDPNNTAVSDINTTADCQERIKQLEQVIKSQQKRLDKIIAALNEQVKENERLNALLPQKDKTNLNSQIKTSFDPNNGIVYKGKKRNFQWFNQMYNRFRDKIVYGNGKYIVIVFAEGEDTWLDNSKKRVGRLCPERAIWPIGTVVQWSYPSEVLSVVNKGEVLITPGSGYGVNFIIYIYGLDGDFVVGQGFPAGRQLVYTGTFKYNSAAGAAMTVPSLTPYPPKPLTKEQFAEAINSGIELINENKQPVP